MGMFDNNSALEKGQQLNISNWNIIDTRNTKESWKWTYNAYIQQYHVMSSFWVARNNSRLLTASLLFNSKYIHIFQPIQFSGAK